MTIFFGFSETQNIMSDVMCIFFILTNDKQKKQNKKYTHYICLLLFSHYIPRVGASVNPPDSQQTKSLAVP